MVIQVKPNIRRFVVELELELELVSETHATRGISATGDCSLEAIMIHVKAWA